MRCVLRRLVYTVVNHYRSAFNWVRRIEAVRRLSARGVVVLVSSYILEQRSDGEQLACIGKTD